ncbi:MAG: DUF2304 domain-containing protein [Lachnospiraceae bacterium]|jgi:hypothetical protein|nr:DUF2304 domain-containing protein [Lachnospiraceae bacterium]
MSLVLRIVLIAASLLTTLYIMKKIRNSKAQIEDAIFWILLAFMLIVISIFPGIPTMISQMLGIMAPVNFLFLFMIFVLLVKIFSMSLKVSALETRLRNLTQEIAIRNKKEDEYEETKEIDEK